MMKKPANSFFLFLIIVLAAVKADCQQHYAFSSELSGVEKTGFYKIWLPPGMLAKCHRGDNAIKDIRLIGQDKILVPYILQIDNIGLKKDNFVEFPLLENKTEKTGKTNVIIQNPGFARVEQLIFVIRNTEACRTATLSGSDDRNQWFVIKEHIFFNCYYQGHEGDFLQTVGIAPSNYRFFKLTIEEDKQLPIGIIKAGVYKDTAFKVVYDSLPQPVFSQKDSGDGNSYIKMSFSDAYLVDNIQLEIEGTKFFRRDITIQQPVSPVTNNVFGPFILSSATTNNFNIYGKGKLFLLVIQNGDNPPLKVAAIKATSYKWFMIAYLDNKKKYTLQFGNDSVAMPKYDLAFFIDSIGATIETARAGELVKNEMAVADKPVTHDNSWMIWTAIGVALVTLLFFTRKMFREVDKRKQHDNI